MNHIAICCYYNIHFVNIGLSLMLPCYCQELSSDGMDGCHEKVGDDLDMSWEAFFRVESGMRRYERYALLAHLPIAWIVESGIPAAAAAVAPPIRKECVFRFIPGSEDCNICENRDRVKNEPSLNENSGPRG